MNKKLKAKIVESTSSQNKIKVKGKNHYFGSQTPSKKYFSLNSTIVGKWIKKEKCIICFMDIIDDDNILRCPHCDQPAHKPHIKDWLLTKQYCPVCKQTWRI